MLATGWDVVTNILTTKAFNNFLQYFISPTILYSLRFLLHSTNIIRILFIICNSSDSPCIWSNICDLSVQLLHRLVRFSHRLVRFSHRLVMEHCSRKTDNVGYFNWETLEAGSEKAFAVMNYKQNWIPTFDRKMRSIEKKVSGDM